MNLAGTLSDTDVLCSGGVPQGYILIHVLFLLLIINDLLSTWKNRNALFADNATWHAILGPQFWLIFSVNHCMTGWCIWLVQLIGSTTPAQYWVVMRHQSGICVLNPRTSFRGETSGGVTKCRLFLHARISFFLPLYFGLNGKRSSLLIIFWHKSIYFLNLSAYQQQEQQHIEHQFLYIIFFPIEGWKRDSIIENDPEIQEIADRGEFHTLYILKRWMNG